MFTENVFLLWNMQLFLNIEVFKHIEHFEGLSTCLWQRNICLDITLHNSLALMIP